MSGNIFDNSNGRCEAFATLKGAPAQCDLAIVHTGWAHQNAEHELIWQAAPPLPVKRQDGMIPRTATQPQTAIV